MSVATLDFDAEFKAITDRLKAERVKRLRMPSVRMFDGNWVLRGRVNHSYASSFQELDSETGMGTIELPLEHYLAQWVVDHDSRPTKNVHIAVDKDGVRWTGRMDRYEIDKTDSWHIIVRVIFKHDYEELKHILVWSNPFLPAEIQFPRLWLLFGPARWCVKTTLFVNILRLESSLWSLPDDPLNLSNWGGLDQSNWSMVVKPDTFAADTSLFAIIHSRFKDFHSVVKPTLEDAQLTPTFRRFLTGDAPPWAGANLRNGCLVIDIEDKSDWATGTSFGGDIFAGLLYAATHFNTDGYNDGTVLVADPAWPAQYSQPGWKSILPGAPGIIYRDASGHSGIQTSLFTGSPAKDAQHVTGGHSMPGVNELISAAIQMAGDLIAAMIGVPPVGGAADALLKPLYTDVFLAFMAVKDLTRTSGPNSLGFSHYKERWADGADKAYSIAAILSLRTSLWATRETFTHKLTVADGCPWLVGQSGYGNFYLGDRIGSTVQGTPKGKVYVDRVSEITLTWDRKTSPTWNITIGQRKAEDPVIKAMERIQEMAGLAHDLGVL